MTQTRNKRRMLEGVVTSDKMVKTVTVLVTRTYQHPKYKKFVREQSKYHAHDENEEAKPGDRVEIMACRPLSKSKRWRLVRVVAKATQLASIDLGTEGGGDA
ncbi:MAG: 30S ribosomal protein S17 [Planctomycetes bacterium]|nr:30S ribosomal protein S17 [Planctomycetota bacterium]